SLRKSMFITQLWGWICKLLETKRHNSTGQHDLMYSILLLWGFLLVFFAPVPFYLLYRRFPNARFDLVNIPLICTELKLGGGQNAFSVKAFDSAAQIATMTIFFCLNGVVK
ncbi:418_t:CDS:2, partial [Gigaspora rosea]